MALRVVDLFCGAGGFSEGFSQMGFKVTHAVDLWSPAVVTHRHNHPTTEVHEIDILQLDPRELGKVDVLIGSPPCTSFSYANKGGKGDRAEGMKLVLRQLQLVKALKPKYWLMENVPRLLETLPQEVNLADADLEGGTLKIPRREILNAADYGAPQKRLRLVSGNYPLPRRTHFDSQSTLESFDDKHLKPWVRMKSVFDALPNPLSERDSAVTDPNYPWLSIASSDLTEHFYDSRMSRIEAEANRRAKTDHSWYGRMRFPDDPERPARTIMATQLKSSRETIAIEVADGKTAKSYRQPTVRECATLQTFPITYQFWGGSPTAQYMLVGNAVPPLLSRALAAAILEAEGLKPPSRPRVQKAIGTRPPMVNYAVRTKKGLRGLPLNRKFRDHVPGSRMGGVRIDFDNLGTSPKVRPVIERCCGGAGSDEKHVVQWVARLYAGSGKTVECQEVDHSRALLELIGAANDSRARRCIQKFVRVIAKEWPDAFPDATTLQGVWSERTGAVRMGPNSILKTISKTVDSNFPEDIFERQRTPRSGRIPIVPKNGMTVRAAAHLLGASFAAEIINSSDRWLLKNWARQFRPEEWGEPGPRPLAESSWHGDVGILEDLERIIQCEDWAGTLASK